MAVSISRVTGTPPRMTSALSAIAYASRGGRCSYDASGIERFYFAGVLARIFSISSITRFIFCIVKVSGSTDATSGAYKS
jgi:hypothetical protein